MKACFHRLLSGLALFSFLALPGWADKPHFVGSRAILHTTGGGKVEQIAKRILDVDQPALSDHIVQKHWNELPGYYFRLIERKWVISDGKLSDGAVLSVKPFSFLTTPYIAFGRSLYDVYSDLGYDAVSLLEMEGKEMVAVLFTYPASVTLYSDRNGNQITDGVTLDTKRFLNHVYIPTWANAFDLLRLCAEAGVIRDLTAEERKLALDPGPTTRSLVANTSYGELQRGGGAAFQYRQLLERHLGMNPHFLGLGITENTIQPNNRLKGVPEFVGPSFKLADLPELVVIDLGKMQFVEVHE